MSSIGSTRNAQFARPQSEFCCYCPFFFSEINIFKLIIGLTIFRRWRAVHGAEEQPSPGGFAMVFQKAPFATKTNGSNSNKNNITTTTNNKTSTAAADIYDDSGGFETSIINNNARNTTTGRGRCVAVPYKPITATSTLSSMVNLI